MCHTVATNTQYSTLNSHTGALFSLLFDHQNDGHHQGARSHPNGSPGVLSIHCTTGCPQGVSVACGMYSYGYEYNCHKAASA